ncbi:MAG: carbohydrate ABC transporter permease [Alphaproteobacteria bacterium]
MWNRIIGSVLLIAVVIVWVIPFAGLAVTSIRPQKDANETGFWTAFYPIEQGYQIRTLPAEDGGSTLIAGNLLQTKNEELHQDFIDANERSSAYTPPFFAIKGDVARIQVVERLPREDDPTKTRPVRVDKFPGEPFELTGGVFEFSANGDYTWTFPEDAPYTKNKGKRLSVFIEREPQFGFRSYRQVLSDSKVPNAIISSFVVTIPATIIPITIAAFAAYAFAWMTFPGRNFIFIGVVALLVVPLQLAFLPVLIGFSSISNWLTAVNQLFTNCQGAQCDVSSKSFAGLWISHTAFGLPLAIYLLRNYIVGLPRDILESARMDGATHLQIFLRLIIPLSVPALASFGIFQFLWVWNDLLVALFLGPNADTDLVLPRVIQKQLGTFKDQLHLLNTSAVISMIVPLIVFLSLQRYFVRGLLAGSVKGG